MIGRRALAAAVAGAAMMLATGCAGPGARPPAAAPGAESPSATRTPGGLSHRVTPGPAPTRARPFLPRFSATVSGPLALRDVTFSWHPGCPVPPRQLRTLHLSYVGFDGTAQIGQIIVSASVARQVIEVFAVLYRARFPIGSMKPVDVFHGSDPRSMAADNASGFNCRRAVASGPPQWSMHAYGLAIDVNTVQNPYIEPGAGVQPPAGAAYLNRSDIRPGWPTRGESWFRRSARSAGAGEGPGPVAPDYQHFSVNGR